MPQERIFLEYIHPRVFDSEKFKIADPTTAASYSFEVHPEYLYYNITKQELPMGCHNWMNNQPQFWANFIEK